MSSEYLLNCDKLEVVQVVNLYQFTVVVQPSQIDITLMIGREVMSATVEIW